MGKFTKVAPLLIVCATLVHCGTDPGNADPHKPGLALLMMPGDAVVRGRFSIAIAVNDRTGVLQASDNSTEVKLALVTGHGTLGGTLVQNATNGVARFDDLTYDRWESVQVHATTTAGPAPVSTPPFMVRPVLSFVTPPPFHLSAGAPLGALDVQLTDGMGAPFVPVQPISVHLAATGATLDPAAIADAKLTSGPVTFSGVSLSGVGRATLIVTSPGLEDLMHPIFSFDMLSTQTLWLPAARVGVPYSAQLPANAGGYTILDSPLQDGLTLDAESGAISGTPSEPRHARLQLSSADAQGATTLWLVDLSVFPQDETSTASLDDLNRDGPYHTMLMQDQITVASRNNVVEKIRIHVPTNDGTVVASGRFPVIVFQHGFAWITDDHPKIYDRYDELLKRWATWGYVVISIDAVDLMFFGTSQTKYTSSTLRNWTALSENQRAGVAWIKARNEDAVSPFVNHIDTDHILVSGHSRGGGGSVITAKVDPDVMGAILLRPIDPVLDGSGGTMWTGPLAPKPMLLNIAANDEDIVYPMADFLYERHSAAMAAVTILGTVHNGIMEDVDALCNGEGGTIVQQDITCQEDWAISNAYTIAFLKYVIEGDITYGSLLFGNAGLSTRLSPLGTLVRSDRRFSTAIVVDDFADSDAQNNNLGHATTATGFIVSLDEPSMSRALVDKPFAGQYAHANLAFSSAHTLTWVTPSATYRTELGDLDVTGRGAFVFRARSDMGALPGNLVDLQIADASGKSAKINLTAHLGKNGIDFRFSDAIVPVSALVAAGLDTQHLSSMELTFSASSGSLVLDSIRFE